MSEGPAPSPAIVDATARDVDGILDVLTATAAEGRWIATELPYDRASRRETIVASIADERCVLLVARDRESVVGNVSLRPAFPGVLSLAMAVAPDARGRGIGTELLAHALDRAWAAGAHKIALEVFPHNAAAIALYERHGFEREGLLRRHLRRANGDLWDLVVMGRGR